MKAIFEFNAPKSCQKCRFVCGLKCTAKLGRGRTYTDIPPEKFKVERASFCPLKIIDEKAAI